MISASFSIAFFIKVRNNGKLTKKGVLNEAHDFTKGNIYKQLFCFSTAIILTNLLQISDQFSIHGYDNSARNCLTLRSECSSFPKSSRYVQCFAFLISFLYLRIFSCMYDP
ncbi:hypothetical protein CHH80_00950 [Bacillus sp. 7504-2]|nr:hypothetical protein CHH80_00950 [Bacillus sp. 7504-2]